MAQSAEKKTVVDDTTLDLTLSGKLQKTLHGTGVYAYAVYFDAHDAEKPVWTTLVDNGKAAGKGTSSIPLTQTDNGTFEDMVKGKIYVLIQSRPDTGAKDLTKLITTESDINWNAAKANHYRYDSFEVTLQDASTDTGNLTSVNGFGLPMKLKVAYDDGEKATAGYAKSGHDLFRTYLEGASKGSVSTFGVGHLADYYRMALSPAESVGNGLDSYKASDWDAYLDAVRKPASDIVIAGLFNGAPDHQNIYHNAGFYSYKLSWDGKNDVFWLDPTASSQIRGRVQLTPEDLANSIYATLGNVGIYADGSDTLYRILDHPTVHNADHKLATMGSGDNNQWGAMLAQFLTGFSAGYYNSVGKSVNAAVTDRIDLNQTWNWDPTYAFGEHLWSKAHGHYDKYAKVFFDLSNSYGSGYSDGLMRALAKGSPLVSVSQPGASANVSKISLTIYDDDEAPEGYTPKTIYNHIGPEKGGYTAATPGADVGNINVGLNFANVGMVLKDKTPIRLEFYQGNDTWQGVTLPVSGGDTLWQNWTITAHRDGSYAATAAGVAQPKGYLVIQGFPGMEKGVHWTKITVGTGRDAKTFNLYTETDGSAFLNPLYHGQEGVLAIDGLATIAPQASKAETVSAITVNFLGSANNAISSDLLQVVDTPYASIIPSAPVALTMDHGKLVGLPGQATMVGPSATTQSGEVQFGWTGLNPSPDTPSWIGGYTNKIGALNFAQVTLTPGHGGPVVPVATTADLDGQWATPAARLGNGVYSVTMKEYLGTDTHLTDAIGNESSALTLTVRTAGLDLRAALAGRAVKLDSAGGAGDGIDGNWVSITATGVPPAAGSTVAVVLMDRSGALVDAQTGKTAGVTMAEATLATLGGLSPMVGGPALLGVQSVYLPTNLRLGFVSLDPVDGAADAHVPAVAPDGNGGVRVTLGNHVLDVKADNTLSDAALLAHAQRMTGEPFVYVRQGAELNVDLAGLSETANRLAFVRADVDLADGSWSVGGLTPGEAGFDAAVRAGLDGDFMLRGRGSFRTDGLWTVEGGTGFYAPVVLTRAGDVLFAPAENGDPGDGGALRVLGQNFFAFEDGAGSRDFDDLTVEVTPVPVVVDGRLDGRSLAPLVLQDRAEIRDGDTFRSDLPKAGGAEHGLTLLATPDQDARLDVGGRAVFHGAGGVKIDGGAGRVVVESSGRLILRGDGEVLDVGGGGGPVVLTNDGLVRGDIRLSQDDDIVRGPGLFAGEVSLRAGRDLFSGGDGHDLARGNRGADRLTGGDGDDMLFGGRGNDTLRGGTGDDALYGRRGLDDLHGGAGRDEMRGGRGNDRLDGGHSADELTGGPGNDRMTGGAGADRFVLQRQNGRDRIADFDVDRDSIDLTALHLDPADAAARIAAAVGTAANGDLTLDLSAMGATGAVRFHGLDPGEAADIAFLI
ncbi:hypothetical protein [Chachezhania sediminis]|uniref:hypothetical protein n=1 Tax=Chachezhania sediminis TaxID=2599291 RepID=UPI00131E769D|nr:hypothetical protein [Chachezhania sediminis]